MTIRRGAVVGCGFFARNHLNAWRELSDRARIVAVCDMDGEKAAAAAAEFDISASYDDFETMLDAEKPDFVDIITTAPSHRKLVEACAARGIAAVVQKPLAPDWEDCCALVAAMDKAGRPLMVHENFRFQAPLLRAAEIARSGVLGEPTWGRFAFRTGFDIYKGQPYLAEVDRFVLLDIGVHVFDVARVFMGEAESVYCLGQSIKPGINGEDQATVLMRHASGAVSVSECSYASRQEPDLFPQTLVQFEATKGSIRLEADGRLVVTSPEGNFVEVVAAEPMSWSDERWLLIQDSVVSTQRHWLDSLDAGTEPATSGHDNLNTFALVEAAYKSIETGGPVVPESFARA
jgi:predicted dehydrogenase